ncbi:LLM class oxidoreductase [Neptunomonas qingdaonensis]|uniref:Luciferase-type oxidoreductase, BA3436 family n=1 Tax=Neptunomonas qingdaonensis TaxID=1045558 RepID=A0A1I2V8C0_9GAMM|nr:LLM class oxidoreductase [Neptunomonas qingdaonensis]SFG84447.1 luciferase-type oxidoreductase, BA3436 family [Neptunomonas qingdaonensis]
MRKLPESSGFQPINKGYNSVFRPDKLSLGVVVPLETYDSGPVATMKHHLERIQLVEKLGFSAIWLRDVPFNVPSFGDAGQLFDPFVYLGFLAGQTDRIALGVASIVLPLRHPAHVAKAAASIDQLSGGRLILGVASGDRPEEYPAHNLSFDDRGKRFRESFGYIKHMWKNSPVFENGYGRLSGDMDMLPKPVSSRLPLLITGGSQQDPAWIAENADGWIMYPRSQMLQSQIIQDWRARLDMAGRPAQPVMQPLYVDLADDPDARAKPIHLGFRLGSKQLKRYLKSQEEIGVNHVAINLRFNQADTESTLKRLAEEVLPDFLNHGE